MQKQFNVLFENIMSRLQNGGYDGGDFVTVDKSVLKHPMFANVGGQLRKRLEDYVNTKNRLKVSVVKSGDRPAISYTVNPENPVDTLVDVIEELAPGLWQNPITLPLEVLNRVMPDGGNLTPDIPNNWKRESQTGKIENDKNPQMMPNKNVDIPVGKSHDPIKTIKKAVKKESMDLYVEAMMKGDGVVIKEAEAVVEDDDMGMFKAPQEEEKPVSAETGDEQLKKKLLELVQKTINMPVEEFDVVSDTQKGKNREVVVSGYTNLRGFQKPLSLTLNIKPDKSIAITGKYFDRNERERRIQQQGWGDVEATQSTAGVTPEDESEVKSSSLDLSGEIEKKETSQKESHDFRENFIDVIKTNWLSNKTPVSYNINTYAVKNTDLERYDIQGRAETSAGIKPFRFIMTPMVDKKGDFLFYSASGSYPDFETGEKTAITNVNITEADLDAEIETPPEEVETDTDVDTDSEFSVSDELSQVPDDPRIAQDIQKDKTDFEQSVEAEKGSEIASEKSEELQKVQDDFDLEQAGFDISHRIKTYNDNQKKHLQTLRGNV